MQGSIKEGRIILIAALIQFVNILDFMMVMPLGPDFAKSLNIPTHDIGLIGGIYTFAASIVGLLVALFLDQFPRKNAIIFTLIGLSLATLSGAIVWNKESMIVSRLIAGAFGGPLTALSISLIADYIPPQRRGIAMGKVMGGFSLASVIGVPFGLELSRIFSWHMPFITTGILGIIVTIIAYKLLPYHKPYLKSSEPLFARFKNLLKILESKLALSAYAFMALSMMSGFIIIPNISAHLQINLNYPRENLGLLYFFGGGISFFTMRLAGKLVDKYSATKTVLFFSLLLVLAISAGFVWYENIVPTIPILLIFICFMVAMTGRSVCAQTLSSKIPPAEQRGAYMSLQSSITHMASALGAYYSSLILVDDGNKLINVPTIGLTSIALTIIVPLLFFYAERGLRKRNGLGKNLS
jgi:predicted MFS family arabinose efflux permease